VKATILLGNVLERLSEIPEGSVQTCITSPPYFGLRDYGTASWEGGDPDCEHTISAPDADAKAVFAERVTRGDRSVCLRCGADRIDAQIGLEDTPELYVASMVKVFREIHRVLANDGTVWLNLGDSYWGGKGASNQAWSATHTERETLMGKQHHIVGRGETRPTDRRHPTIKPKDLVGIPWRVALALQDDGWYLRQDIIWSKPNPMPESVRDRCTKSHEYVFLLTKKSKYYCDMEPIREPVKATSGGMAAARRNGNLSDEGYTRVAIEYDEVKGANKRSVWTVPTKPFKGAHFAVMPEALVEPCILAGSRPGDTVLDPFTGSGTVAVVALRHGRNFVGTELNPEYAEIAERRIADAAPLMNEVTVL